MLYNLLIQDLEGKAGKPKVRLRGVALPNEHGSWGILLEPLVAALAVAPSGGGFFAALFVVGAFLSRQPAKIVGSDLKAGRRLPQTRAAAAFLAAYGSFSAVGLTGAFYFSETWSLLPLLALVPFGIFQFYNDISRKNRELIPELAGAIAISSSAPAIAMSAGWNWPEAALLWCVFVCRSVPSVVYVRQRLRLEKGKPFTRSAPVLLHAAGLGAVAALVIVGSASYLILPVFAFLMFRSVSGLSARRRKLKAVQLGIRETIYGAVLVLSVIIGFYTGL